MVENTDNKKTFGISGEKFVSYETPFYIEHKKFEEIE